MRYLKARIINRRPIREENYIKIIEITALDTVSTESSMQVKKVFHVIRV